MTDEQPTRTNSDKAPGTSDSADAYSTQANAQAHAFAIRPIVASVLKRVATAPHAYVGIRAAAAPQKASPVFPFGRNAQALEYAIAAAKEWWPGEADWSVDGADLLYDQARLQSAQLPGGASLFRDATEVCQFSDAP